MVFPKFNRTLSLCLSLSLSLSLVRITADYSVNENIKLLPTPDAHLLFRLFDFSSRELPSRRFTIRQLRHALTIIAPLRRTLQTSIPTLFQYLRNVSPPFNFHRRTRTRASNTFKIRKKNIRTSLLADILFMNRP